MNNRENQVKVDSSKGGTRSACGQGALSILLANAYQEYRHLAIDRQNIQLTYIKTYITLASVIIGAVLSAAIFFKVAQNGALSHPQTRTEIICLLFVGISLLTALAVFVCGVDLLRGREKRPLPFAKIKLSYVWVKENKHHFPSEEQLEVELLESLLQPVVDGIEDLLIIVARVGKRLRIMSLVLIISTFSGLIGFGIRIFSN
ncbi:hypothetical protein HMPREF0326_05722 [Desulfovibrio sp. 3_1_syn3]|uniref:hypothetical protein n=1 Tax=Desulfovibrio sp. 3_1_syn3 TaxID=457398 RepID=UPI00038FAE38|nr:hypothetical protein [Desulfovibrio sp. 3_1_syn3]EQN50859.1 hypothetical protein HMPREF0326_05722 [Desulfovibrio sp. 3_1_syn3]